MLANTRRSVASASDRLLGSPLRNLIFGVLYMLVVMAIAIGAYVAAGWKFADALYMVIVTVYTVGYGETMPVDTTLLRTITIATIVLGCTGMIYLTGALVQFITLNQINQLFGIKRMSTQIDRLRNHIIVCGFGRIGIMLGAWTARRRRGFRHPGAGRWPGRTCAQPGLPVPPGRRDGRNGVAGPSASNMRAPWPRCCRTMRPTSLSP